MRKPLPTRRLGFRLPAIPLGSSALVTLGFLLSVVGTDTRSTRAQVAPTPGLSPGEIIRDSCLSANPYYITTRQFGSDSGGDSAVIIATKDTPNDTVEYPANPSQYVLGSYADVGAVYGVAYDAEHNHAYFAAHHHPASRFGPGGPGAIYRLDLSDESITIATRLPAGPDRHNPDDSPEEGYEAEVTWIGRTSLGDIETDGGSALFAVNLEDRRIYSFALPAMRQLAAFDHGAAAELWAHNARPFGLGFREGWLYHGVVDSREDASLPGALSAHVYRSRPDGSAMSEVASFGLDYTHEPPWSRWSDAVEYEAYPIQARSQPLLSDIEFRPDGDLILGLADRWHWFALAYGYGDVLPTSRIDPALWSVDTGSDHFRDEIAADTDGRAIEEGFLGALAAGGATDTIVATGMKNTWAGGLRWQNNQSGAVDGPEDGLEYVFGDLPPIGDVESLCPQHVPPTATVTPQPSASVTPTSTPTAPSTSTSTAPPTPTATPRPVPIYLPVALREQCKERRVHADVTLVLDVSTSMRRQAGDGRTKLAEMSAAAVAFVEHLHLTADHLGAHDQVAIVGFNDAAWIQQGLTADRFAIDAAVRELSRRVAEGTRLDLALEVSASALTGQARIQTNTPVLVLLTDGLPNRVPLGPSGTQEETVLARASYARNHGIEIYTVGVGNPDGESLDRINPELLRAIASDPGMYYEASDPTQLADIYTAIARRVTCPPDDFWGRR